MDDIAAGQAVGLGWLCLSGFAAAERAAFREQLRSGRTVDRAIHTAAAKQGGVGRIDDRVRLAFGDIALNDLQAFHMQSFFLGVLLDILYGEPNQIASLTHGMRKDIIITE